MTVQVSFKVSFKSRNEAFQNGEAQSEVCWILNKIATKIERGDEQGAIHDSAGNNIGKWFLGIESDDDCEDDEDDSNYL